MHVRLTPPRLSATKSPDADDVVIAIAVVAVDCEAEHEAPHGSITPVTVNKLEVAEVSPGAVAARSYPAPALSICRFPNAALPFELAMVVVPVSVPPPGLVPIEIVTSVPFAETSAGLSGWLFASSSCTVSGSPLELNPVRMWEVTAVWAGCPVKARLHFPVTGTLSGAELHWTSLVSPKVSVPDTPQTSVPAVTQGASAVTYTVKVLPALLGRSSVTVEAGNVETEVPLGPEAAVIEKSAGALNVRLTSLSFWSLSVTWNAYCCPVPAAALTGGVTGVTM